MKKIALGFVLMLALSGCAPAEEVGVPDTDTNIQPSKGAPDFDLENIAGGTTKAAALQGKVAIIDFWATWCQPCIEEIPKFNELHDRYQGKDVQIIAVTIESPYEDIAPKVKETGIKYPVLVGNDNVVDGFGGIIGFPTTFVVTKDWKIYKKYFGALSNKHDRIRQDIEKLLVDEANPVTAASSR
jgi:cytochrome c biogenesis protein CcmG/thiol:disulfide interchange protein DsbE